jgi:hypothetical protein
MVAGAMVAGAMVAGAMGLLGAMRRLPGVPTVLPDPIHVSPQNPGLAAREAGHRGRLIASSVDGEGWPSSWSLVHTTVPG